MKPLISIFAFIFFLNLIACSTAKNSIEIIQQNTLKVENRNYTVKANYAVPLRMRQISLTSNYDLQIKNDSAFAFLPYYGVAHVAPMNPSEGGIKFQEKMIDYIMQPNKKRDGWIINFKINTRENHYQVAMNIYNNGNSYFTISSYERDAITFYGELK